MLLLKWTGDKGCLLRYEEPRGWGVPQPGTEALFYVRLCVESEAAEDSGLSRRGGRAVGGRLVPSGPHLACGGWELWQLCLMYLGEE